MAASALLGLACLAAPAQATPWVTAYASAQGPLNQGAIAGYNVLDVPGCSGTGPCASTNLNGQPPDASVSAFANGALSGMDTQTSVGAQTSGYPYRDPLPLPTVSTSTAAANLADGTLHAAAANNATGVAGPSMAWFDWAGGRAWATLRDRIHFVTAGPTTVNFTFTIDGTIGHGPLPDYTPPMGAMETLIAFGGKRASALLQYDQSVSGASRPLVYGDDWQNFNPDSHWVRDEANDVMTFFGSFDIDSDHLDWDLSASLEVNCGSGVQCDFGNTARIAFALPDGVTFTSDSNTFLSAAGGNGGGTVPEPASGALVGVALAALSRRFAGRARR